MIIQDLVEHISPDTTIELWTDSVVNHVFKPITLYKGPTSNFPSKYLTGTFDLWRASNENEGNCIHIWYLGERSPSQLTLRKLLRAYWCGLEWEYGYSNQSLNVTLTHNNRSILLASCDDYLHPPLKAADFLPADQRSIPNIMSLFQSIGAEDDLRRIFVLDAIILNIDRHMGNFGVSFDTETMQILGAAPEYDNNRSLLFDLDDDQLQNYAWYVPHYTPRIGTSFIGVAQGMMTDAIKQDIKNLRGFEFQQHPTIDIPKQRLQMLSEIVNLQVKTILNE